MSKEKTIGEEYRDLLKQKEEIQKQIHNIVSTSCIFDRCNNVIPFSEIDPLTIQEESCYNYFDAWADYYVPCNVPNICKACKSEWCTKQQEIDRDTFTKILEAHNMTYADWNKNKKTKSTSKSC